MRSVHKRNLCWLLASFLLNFSSPTQGFLVRLTGTGSTRCSGRVEIYSDSTWGTVCDDNWDLKDAQVVCRQLSCGTAEEAPGGAAFGEGSGPIFLDDVACSGSEGSLTQCGHRGLRTHNCGHGEDAGVICSGFRVRLTGSGSTQCSGRVEILSDSTWGTVCDDNWDLNDAEVVCRQMDCGTAVKAPGGAAFGQGSGPIFLDDVACSGSEGSLTQCGHRGLRTHDCKHSEDAGVICSASIQKPRISQNPTGTVTWGQGVRFTCSVTSGISVGTFVLTKTSGSFREIQTPNTGTATFSITKVNFEHEGSYQCQYEKSSFGQTFRSTLSDSVRLSLTVSFPKPSISMSPVGGVTWGQGVRITCSIRTELLGGTFTLTKTSGSFRKTQTSNTGTATFSITKVDFEHEGSYQCQYEKSNSGRTFRSTLSDSVRLSLTVSFPKPSISMSPVGGVTWGQGVRFTCSIRTELLGGTFTLTKTSGSFRKTQTSNTGTATFSITKVDFEHEGSYRCQYEKSNSGRTFRSTLSDSVTLSLTVSFPKPSISMSPVGGVTWGQGVSITCLIRTELLGGTFILTKTSGSFRKTQTSNTGTATFNITKVDFEHEGSYQCQYEKSNSGRTFRSTLSDSVRLSLTVSFPKPSISMSPVGEVTWGQGVSITCSIRTELLGGTFTLTKTSGSFRKTQTSNTGTALFSITKVDFEHEGSYQCQYEKSNSGRTFRSTLSDSVTLSLTVSFPKPSISMSPVGGVTWGQGVSITCLIRTELLGGTFILTKTSGSFRKTQTSNTGTATFSITKVDFEHEGSYQCQYEKSNSGRTFRSTLSDSVTLSLTVSFPKPSISMSPVGGVTWGQGVSITCLIRTELLGGTFTLTKTSGSFRKTQTPNSRTATFNFTKVDFEHEGSYQCQYEKSNSGRTFRSTLSDPVRLSLTVSFPKPSISMSPVGGVTWGQGVSITCLIRTELLGGTFTLTKTSGSFRKTQTSNTGTATFSITKVDFEHEGSYQCQYEKSNSGRTFRSTLSDSVRLSLTVSFPKPSISMSPVGGVTWGQGVSITCLIRTELLGGTFTLTKTSGSFRKTQTSNTGTATFNITKVDFEHEGSYQCQYEKSNSGRTFRSTLSDSVRLFITVRLQQPSISLTSPNKGLMWSPEGAEVTRGYSFVFLCSINCSFPDGRFFLISPDADISVMKPAVNHSASFEFPVAEYEHQGNYSCVYEVELSERRFNSTETAPTRIVIKLFLLPLVSSGAAGISLVLLVVLLVVVVSCRRRKQAKQPGTLDQTQMTERERNCYDKEEDEEEYVNVTPVATKNLKNQKVAGKEDYVYEEPKSVTDFCQKSKMSKVEEMGFREDANREKDQREEEEEETSDEDNEYENVTVPFTKDDFDVYGNQEDIYQNF